MSFLWLCLVTLHALFLTVPNFSLLFSVPKHLITVNESYRLTCQFATSSGWLMGGNGRSDDDKKERLGNSLLPSGSEPCLRQGLYPSLDSVPWTVPLPTVPVPLRFRNNIFSWGVVMAS